MERSIKRIICGLLTLAMVLLLPVPTSAAQIVASGVCCQDQYSDTRWTLDEYGVLTVYGYGETGDLSPVRDGYGQVIGYRSLFEAWKDQIKKVVIGYGITYIGDGTFYDLDELTDIEFPRGYQVGLKGYAFSDCDKLEHVTFEKGGVWIMDHTFENCDSLTSLVFPEGKTAIDDYAFRDCAQLSSVTFYADVSRISDNAFLNVTATVHYPGQGETWDDSFLQDYGGKLTWNRMDGPARPQIQFCYSRNSSSMRVQWDAVEGAHGYQLYRAEHMDPSAGWKCVKTIDDGATTSYTNHGLTVGVTYLYKVRSYIDTADGRVYSGFSDVRFMPSAVVWDAPYSNSTSRIRLRWDEVSSAHGYQIWRKDDGAYRVIKTIGDKNNELTSDQSDVVAYSNVGLTAGTKYTYKMRAFFITPDGGKIFGPYSDEVTVAVQPVAPVVSVNGAGAGKVKLHWDMESEADGYQIWMSEDGRSDFRITKSITDGDALGYTKDGLTSGKTYHFKIRAYSEVEGRKTFGPYSDTVIVTVP